MRVPPTRFPRTLEESCGQRSHREMFDQRPTANVNALLTLFAVILLIATLALFLFGGPTCRI